MPASQSTQPIPSQAQMLAEAYRRNLMRPAQAAAYEAAATRGAVYDPYAAARAAEKSTGLGPTHGASLNFTGSIPFAQEGGAAMAAGAGAIDNMFHGKPADLGGQWNKVRAWQDGYQDQYAADHPIATVGLKSAGIAAQLAAAIGTGGVSEAPSAAAMAARPGLAASAKRMAMTGARNATVGGASASISAAAQPGTLRQRVKAADNAFLPGAAVGMAIPPLLHAVVPPPSLPPETRLLMAANSTENAASGTTLQQLKGLRVDDRSSIQPAILGTKSFLLRPGELPASNDNELTPRSDPVAYLETAGIPLTPGQRAGVPDRLAPTEADARAQGQIALNRVLVRRALAPIGVTPPQNLRLGKPASNYVESRLDNVERLAHSQAKVHIDDTYNKNMNKILNYAKNILPEPGTTVVQRPIDKFNVDLAIAHSKLLDDTNGDVNLDGILNYLDERINLYKGGYYPTHDPLVTALGKVRGEYLSTADRQNPGFGAIQDAVDRGRANLNLMNRANSYVTKKSEGFSAPDIMTAYAEKLADPTDSTLQHGGAEMFNLVHHANAVMGPESSAPAPSSAITTPNAFTPPKLGDGSPSSNPMRSIVLPLSIAPLALGGSMAIGQRQTQQQGQAPP